MLYANFVAMPRNFCVNPRMAKPYCFKLPRGLKIDRGYVCIRVEISGFRYYESVGPMHVDGALETGYQRLAQIRSDLLQVPSDMDPEQTANFLRSNRDLKRHARIAEMLTTFSDSEKQSTNTA